MARFYGGDARESPIPEFGAMEIQLHDGGGKIFAGTSETQTVWESHNDEVHVVPEGSLSQQAAHRVKFKVWRTMLEIASVCNSIPKSTIQSSAKRCSKTSSRFAEIHEMPRF